MLEFITNGATFIFPAGRALKLVTSGVNITNSTNPLTLTKNITLTVIECCAPPPFRLLARCVGAGALITASAVTPNPVTVGSAIHMITEIYTEC